MNFDEAFARLTKYESSRGQAAPPLVSAREYGSYDPMRNSPKDLLKPAYRADIWDAIRIDSLPAGVRYFVFESAIHSTPYLSAKWLQMALSVEATGVLNKTTLAAANKQPHDVIIRRMAANRLRHMIELRAWPNFSHEWAARLAASLDD